MAQIYLVRHTRVDVPPGVCYGISDVPLAASFPEEAQKIMGKIQGIPFDHIFSSPLSRCTRLARLIAPQGFVTDPRLAELNFGEWEGQIWEDIYQNSYGIHWMNNYLELPCPGGESFKNLYHRIHAFINELNKNQNTLIITHAGVIRVFLTVYKGIPLTEIFNVQVGYGEVLIF
jgi:alpha-ribazole phosphatase